MDSHLDLIKTAPTTYFRAKREGVRMANICRAIERSPECWYSWERAAGLREPSPCSAVTPMPRYMAAYLALIDDGHPKYKMSWEPNEWSKYPRLLKASEAEVLAFRQDNNLGDIAVHEAFCYEPMLPDGSVANRQHSIKKLGNDGVRWLLLRLMAGKAEEATITRRAT